MVYNDVEEESVQRVDNHTRGIAGDRDNNPNVEGIVEVELEWDAIVGIEVFATDAVAVVGVAVAIDLEEVGLLAIAVASVPY